MISPRSRVEQWAVNNGRRNNRPIRQLIPGFCIIDPESFFIDVRSKFARRLYKPVDIINRPPIGKNLSPTIGTSPIDFERWSRAIRQLYKRGW